MDYIRFFDRDRYATELTGVELTEVRPGYAKARMEVTPRHLNGGGVVQGGAIFTLADLTAAAAANAHGRLAFSLQSDISYFSNVSSGTLYAEAEELSLTHRTACYRVNVYDGNGTLLAVLSTNLYRKEISNNG